MISRKITLACALMLLAACGSSDSRSGGGGEGGGAGGSTGGKGGGKSGGSGGSKSGGSGGSKATGGTGGTSKTGGAGGSTATGGSPATGGSSATGGSPATGGNPATGGSAATGGSPATGGSAATGGTGGTAVEITMVNWDFETSITPWRTVLENSDSTTLAAPTASTMQKRGGTMSLAIPIDSVGGVETKLYYGIQAEPFVLMGAQKNIKKVTGYLWVPLDHKITYTQMFTFSFGSAVKNEWQGTPATGGLIPGDWTKFEMDFTGKFPNGYPLDNLLAVGFQFVSTVAWKSTVYIDDVTVELMP